MREQAKIAVGRAAWPYTGAARMPQGGMRYGPSRHDADHRKPGSRRGIGFHAMHGTGLTLRSARRWPTGCWLPRMLMASGDSPCSTFFWFAPCRVMVLSSNVASKLQGLAHRAQFCVHMRFCLWVCGCFLCACTSVCAVQPC